MLSLEQEAAVTQVVTSDNDRLIIVRPMPRHDSASIGTGGAVTIAVHAAVGLTMLAFINTHQPHTPRPFLSTPRLVSVVYIPALPVDLPKLELTALPAPKPIVTPEPAPLPPVPVRPIETAVVEPVIAKPVPALVETPRPALAAPAPPVPTVGVFPQATAAARAPVPTNRVEVAGFDAPVKPTTESKLGQATVGAFDSAPNAGARQPGSATGTNTVIAESGFGRPSASVPSPTQQTRVVREGGFGTAASKEQPKSAQPSEVKTAGFANAVAVDNSRRPEAPPPPPAVTTVEVLFKPTPIYTEEARKLRIEGDVILQVDFLATGAVRVIRVVRGLGHGLDEAAVKAAEQIRFKPAQASGNPVDSRNTVSIVFRLA